MESGCLPVSHPQVDAAEKLLASVGKVRRHRQRKYVSGPSLRWVPIGAYYLQVESGSRCHPQILSYFKRSGRRGLASWNTGLSREKLYTCQSSNKQQDQGSHPFCADEEVPGYKNLTEIRKTVPWLTDENMKEIDSTTNEYMIRNHSEQKILKSMSDQ